MNSPGPNVTITKAEYDRLMEESTYELIKELKGVMKYVR